MELPGKHPAEYFIKYLLLKEPTGTPDPVLLKTLSDWGFLLPDEKYVQFLRQRLSPPQGFDPANRLHRPSMKYLRDEEVYELFWPTQAMEEAWDVLSNPAKRLVVEQIVMSQLDFKVAALKINQKKNWRLTAEGLATFAHFFWNSKLLTFDEWGRFLYGRSALYERHMALLQASPQLALYHLRIEQVLESKNMIQRAQEIAYFTLEEVAQRPGTGPDKVKAIGVLTKAVTECHQALSTSDMALKDVLKQFEKFRMDYPQVQPPAIHQLAPGGNFSGSGVQEKKEEKVH